MALLREQGEKRGEVCVSLLSTRFPYKSEKRNSQGFKGPRTAPAAASALSRQTEGQRKINAKETEEKAQSRLEAAAKADEDCVS